MTNKEAIEILKDLWRWEHPNRLEKDIRQALDKGIEALEKQTSVMRELEKVKNRIDYVRNCGMGKNKSLEYIEKYINKEISELKGK